MARRPNVVEGDALSAIAQATRALEKTTRASLAIEKLQTSTLFGVTGGLLGAAVATYFSTLGVPEWQSGPILTSLGICFGHIAYRCLRGLRAEATDERQLDSDRAIFEENLRRMKLISRHAPPEISSLAWQQLTIATFDAKRPQPSEPERALLHKRSGNEIRRR